MENVSEVGITRITANFADAGTKTVLADGGCSILWSPGDEINVFYGKASARFVSTNDEPSEVTIFSSEKPVVFGGMEGADKYIWASYPYAGSSSDGESVTLTVQIVQSSTAGSFVPGVFPAVGRSKSTSIPFYNICGGVCFSVVNEGVKYVTFSGNNEETLAGRVKVQFNGNGVPEVVQTLEGEKEVRLNAPTDEGFKAGVTYYMAVLPQVLERGYTMVFHKEDSCAVLNCSKSVTVKRSVFGSLLMADKKLEYKAVVHRSDVQMEQVEEEYESLRITGSFSFHPDDSTRFEFSKDSTFAQSESISSTVMYGPELYAPNTWWSCAYVPYSKLSTGLWFIRVWAGGTCSDVLRYQYEGVSTDGILKGVLSLEYYLDDCMYLLKQCDSDLECLSAERAGLYDRVNELESRGLDQETISVLKEKLSRLKPDEELHLQIQTMKSNLQGIQSNVKAMKDRLKGVTELPEIVYEMYMRNIEEMNAYLDYIRYGIKQVEYDIMQLKAELTELASEIEDLEEIFKETSAIYSGANCFVVSSYGSHAFNAGYKGNSTVAIEGGNEATVIWESYGTDEVPEEGSVVSNVRYASPVVRFDANADGNAVIAVKDGAGTVLWSWHIWVCKDFDPERTAQTYDNDAGVMMDRNLGATSATPGDVRALGLLYQWGRKDPFLNASSISGCTQAASTITWPKSAESDVVCGNVNYTVSHPTTFITQGYNGDWYFTANFQTDVTRWKTSDKTKGVYDPCPAGWRVPDGGADGVWATAFGVSYDYNGPWNSTAAGMDFGSLNGKPASMQLGRSETIWYPAAGGRCGDVLNAGEQGMYWSATSDSAPNYSYVTFLLDIRSHAEVYPANYDKAKASGYSIRCMRERQNAGGSNEATGEEDWIR